MEKVFKKFSTLLNERLCRNADNTTEDAVRYTFFIALLRQTDITHHEIILEYPHPKIKNAKIDTYIERKGLVIEFKYHRKIPSRRNAPRTARAGDLFNDIYRLTQFPIDLNNSKFTRWFVYLTDSEMADYFKRNNNLSNFFDLQKDGVFEITPCIISLQPLSFIKMIKCPFNAKIKCVWKKEMPHEHYLRVYEILPYNNPLL